MADISPFEQARATVTAARNGPAATIPLSSSTEFAGAPVTEGYSSVISPYEGAPVSDATPQHVLSDTADQTLTRSLTYGLPLLGAGLLDTMVRSIGVFGD